MHIPRQNPGHTETASAAAGPETESAAGTGTENAAARFGRGERRSSSVVITLGIVSILTEISSESVAAILPRDALITASSDPASLGLSFGVRRMLDTIGAVIGPLLAFLILAIIPTGYTVVFVVSVALAIVGVILLGLLAPRRRPGSERAAAQSTPRQPFRWKNLADPRLRRLITAAGILGLFTVGAGFSYLVLQARGSFAVVWFPLLYVGTNLAYFVFAVPLGRFANRFGRVRIFLIGHGALLTVYLLTAIPLSGAALAAQFSPPENTASGIAVTQTVVALSRLLASTGFGALWFTLGRVNAMLIVACVLAVAFVAVVAPLRPLLRPSPLQRPARSRANIK